MKLHLLIAWLGLGGLALVLALGLPQALRLDLHIGMNLHWARFTLVLLALLGAVWLRHWWQAADRRRRLALALDLAWAGGLALLVVLVVPGRALLENDESALAQAAIGIRHTGSLLMPVAGVIDEQGTLHVSAVHVEKRGVLYPALLAPLLQLGLDGPRAARLVNAGALLLLLLAAARLGRRHGAGFGALAVPLLLLGFPLLLVTARIGTFDLLNGALLAALLHLALAEWRAPRPLRAALLVAVAATLAQVRYEALLPAAGALGLLALRALRPAPGDPPTRTGLTVALLAPLALVPATWRMAIPFSLELPPGMDSAWGLQHLRDNLPALLQWTFLPGPAWGSGSVVAGWLAALGLLQLLARRGWQQLSPARRVDVAILALLLLPLLLLLQLSFWGEIGYVVTARYYLFWCLLLALAGSAWLAWLTARHGRPAALATIVLLLGTTAAGLWQARAGARFEYPQAEFRDLGIAAMRAHYGGCPVLVVHPSTVMYLSRGIGAMDPAGWAGNAAGLPPFLAASGIVAVVAPSPLPDGLPAAFPQQLRARLAEYPVAGRSRGRLASATLYELWRHPEPAPTCLPAAGLQRVERESWLVAGEQWRTVVAELVRP